MESEKVITPEGTTTQEWEKPEQPQYLEINWEQISVEEAVKGYLRQSDYTKKTQELAKQREELEKVKKTEAPSEDEAVNAYLKSQGYLTKEDIEKERLSLKEELAMERFFANNPELTKHEDAIRAIAKTDNSALEDIVVKYNFIASDKIQKAKSNKVIVWEAKKTDDQPKNWKDLTADEKKKRKQEHGLTGRRGSFSD